MYVSRSPREEHLGPLSSPRRVLSRDLGLRLRRTMLQKASIHDGGRDVEKPMASTQSSRAVPRRWRVFSCGVVGNRCLDSCFGSLSGFPSSELPSASMGRLDMMPSSRRASASGLAWMKTDIQLTKPSVVRAGM
ncbi:hypothetical protein CDD83_4268 [Cordyceps sp. RAO-2017]|nr:hypothetical protein CDD83_4268 [Cordyceps sp. RAO-2017]